MVPNVSAPGHSFRGAMAYYMHDKRPDEALPHLASSDRVAWTATRNLAGIEDVAVAERAMIATAMDAPNLKREAGIKNSGRQSKAHVYSYSLSWHPSEAAGLSKEDMLRAVDDSLRAIGAETRQAIVICHTDRDHPHVHIVMNRVDPVEGRLWKTDNDRFKLSDWANKYERENGRIVTPVREEKRLAREQHSDRAERRQHAQDKRSAMQERAHDGTSQAAHLRDLGAAQREQHEQARAWLTKRDKAGWRSITDASAKKVRDASRRHEDECKPVWQKHRRELREAGRRFRDNEKTSAGVVRNALFAARHQQATGELGDRSMLSATVRNWFSSEARAKAFEEAGALSEKALSDRLRFIRDTELRQIKVERDRDLRGHRDMFARERADLYGPAKGPRSEQWRDLAEREKAGGRQISLQAGDRIADARNRHFDECRPIWAKHYLERHVADRDFKQNEKTTRGVVKNAWEAARIQKDTGQLGDQSVFGATVRNFFSSQARLDAFEKGAELSKAQLSEQLRGALRQEIDAIRAGRDQALKDHRATFDAERAQMVEKQSAERGKLSEAWQRLSGERGNDRVAGDGQKPYWKPTDRAPVSHERSERLSPSPVVGRMTPAERKARVQAAQERRAAANTQPKPERQPTRPDPAAPISAERRKEMVKEQKAQRKASFADRLKDVQITRPDREEQEEPEKPKPRFWPGPSR